MAIKILITALSLASLLSNAYAAEIYNESGGIVAFEVENSKSPYGLWRMNTALHGYTGSGYLESTGNDYDLGKADSPLFFHFKINKQGIYVFDLHCAKKTVQGHRDWANDCYVRVIGDYSAAPGPHDVPKANASLSLLKRDTKYFGGKSEEWEWASGDFSFTGGRLDSGGKKNKRKALYRFKAGEIYTLVISGRSKSFRINRAMFRLTSVPKRVAQRLESKESTSTDGIPPIPDDLDKTIIASNFDKQSHAIAEETIQKNAPHIGNIRDGSWICFESFDFGTGVGSSIEVQTASANPKGGTIEIRTDSPDGPLIGTLSIHHTSTWNDYELSSSNLARTSGKRDLFLVFRGGNKKLFNLKDFTIRSGVSVDEKLPSPPIRPPAGQVAYLADGNSPDPDDIGGSAAALAMLRAANLADRLVYFAHSCDLVRANKISAEDEHQRQKLLQTACEETAKRWGGFEHILFLNCRTQQSEAVLRLVDQINASSARDPLWILLAGEPDIIGYAFQRASPAKLPFVKLVTHHPANDESGDYFTWKQILGFGVEVVRIPDQNGYDGHLGRGLQRPLWAFHWARDHTDSRIRWLWEQGKLAEADGVVSFQDGKFDISDAGMMMYWITGANSKPSGYREATVHDVRKLLEDFVADAN